MNYPVWYLETIAGGSLIALIAVTHVFVAHFAVGGGLYLVLAERFGLRRDDPGILEFTRRHARFFILVTLVYGSITGVGIWFIISLVQPSATSLLIHNFVFAWGTEWVFFLVEIVAATIYFYTFGRMEPKRHQAIGWIYFISAWLSLFLINGIITFMLSPGAWLETGSFWDGFFNPTFWPSLFFRTFIAFLLAGVYAFVTTGFLRDRPLRRRMTRFSAWWVLISAAGALPSGYWYLQVLPETARELVLNPPPQLNSVLTAGIWTTAALLLLTLIFCLIRPQWHNRAVGLLVLACGLGMMGGFEWAREASRRPFVVREVMYSNSIQPGQVESIRAEGFLSQARWTQNKTVTEENRMAAGEEIFRLQCYACHTLGGWNNDLAVRTAGMDYQGLLGYIENIHQIRPFMPPFAGTEEEAAALAGFLAGKVHGKEIPEAVHHEVVEADRGMQIFNARCTACHDAEVVQAGTVGMSMGEIADLLENLSQVNPAMPDFQGTAEEKEHLVHYIFSLNHPAASQQEGRQVYQDNCSFCHQLKEGPNALADRVDGWGRERIRRALDKLPQLNPAMPPFNAPPEKKEALADFLFRLQNGDFHE